MNIEIVEDEIYDFCSEYFKNEIALAHNCETYIDVHNLPSPKENYAILAKFLNLLLRRMLDLDLSAISLTLLKLNTNVQILSDGLVNLEKKIIDPSHIIFNKFIVFSNTLQASNKFKNYKELEKIYFEIFKKIFYNEVKTLKHEIGHNLNTLSFYTDKLIWIEAHNSHFIKKHFEINGTADVLNSKNYITHSLTLMRKFTKEYDYYMSCKKVFK
jgi:hypothetical protein